MINVKCVVIGGGAAGMAAALGAKQQGLDDILILEYRKELGGVLNQCIHNGFGLHYFNRDMTGPEYSEAFAKKISEENIPYDLNCTVLEVNKYKVITATAPNKGVFKIKAEAIIIATGAREKSLNSLILESSRPSGMYSAGTVQEMMNRKGVCPGSKAVIVGSGDIGLIMARRMALNGVDVKAVLEIASKPSGFARNIQQCLKDFSIPIYMNTTIIKILGKESVEKVVVANVDENLEPIPHTEREVDCDIIVSSIGLVPDIEILVDGIGEGIFLCGNALRIQGLVDHVTLGGLEAGKLAAEYIIGGSVHTKDSLADCCKDSELVDEINSIEEDGQAITAVTCILCPKGCFVQGTFDTAQIKVWGNKCNKGHEFFLEEIREKKRTFTGSVRLNDEIEIMLPVRSDRPIPQSNFIPLTQALKKYKINPPISMGDIVISNPFGMEVNIKASRSVGK